MARRDEIENWKEGGRDGGKEERRQREEERRDVRKEERNEAASATGRCAQQGGKRNGAASATGRERSWAASAKAWRAQRGSQVRAMERHICLAGRK